LALESTALAGKGVATLIKVEILAKAWALATCVVWLAACASQAPATAPAAAAADAKKEVPAAPKPAAQPPRKLPRMQYPMNIDWYPSKAKKAHDTGRVLVGFTIDSKGKAASLKILKAEAPRILRNAALNFVTDVSFDVSDPAYNSSDPAPYAISVRFCIIECGTLVGFPGYEDARITGSPLSPLGSL
jgi:TonB family protein